MPSVSQSICLSSDNNYLFVAGAYKPVVKCYDFNELSLKFERGLDSEVIKMLVLSNDYSKLILLEDERFVEFHASYGRYFRMRIPELGRDMAFCHETSELNIVGCHNSIFRLNLEQGTFFEPLHSESPSLNCCAFDDGHQLLVCGTCDGRVEAWDYRDRSRVAILDCVLNNGIALELDEQSIPEVTAVKFKDPLHLGVGLSSGHVLLYDIRNSKPYTIKNHQFGLPVTCLDFVQNQNLVLSMDRRVMKIWHEENGRPFCSIEPGKYLNDFLLYPDSGLIFFANDDPKVLQYFIPSLGPAPKWCSHLDAITEEMEEMEQLDVYDDYKFVTKLQLEELGLSRLIGTNAVRAYMHGYFIDMSAYKKAKAQSQISIVENYRRRKLKEKLEDERQIPFVNKKLRRKLPKINQELASRLQMELSLADPEESSSKKPKTSKTYSNLLTDGRFADLFQNPDFEIIEDISVEQLSKHNRKRTKSQLKP